MTDITITRQVRQIEITTPGPQGPSGDVAGGTVTSVNGLAGVVVLTTTNIAEGTNLYFTGAERAKLEGIATAATANSSDAQLRDRSTHTGAQAISTVTGLQTVLDGKAALSHTHTASQVTDFSTAADARITAQKAQANGLATLGADGKIPSSQVPAVALVDVYTVDDETEQLALTAEEGDVAIRTDQNKSYVHNGGTAGTMADWSNLLTPTDAVLSVNGQTGSITLTTTHIAEGTNEYFTIARAKAAAVADAINNGTTDVAPSQNSVFDALAGKSDTGHGHAISDVTGLQTELDGKAAAAMTINTQTDSYTLVLGDATKYIRMNKATAVNLTVPANSSVAFLVGTQIPFRQVGAGQVTVVAGGGVTINTAETLKLRTQGSTGSLIKVATDEWDLAGDLEESA